MSINTATLNGVATIEIARPEKKNAITGAMYQQMADALNAAVADNAVRAVLITGQPGIFTSGNDIEDFMKRPPGSTESPAFVFMKALMGCDKPVIAAVTGAAIGIGTTMLLHCDFVYVSDEARLAMPFASLGSPTCSQIATRNPCCTSRCTYSLTARTGTPASGTSLAPPLLRDVSVSPRIRAAISASS